MTAPKITWVNEPNDSPMMHLGPDPAFVAEVGRFAGVRVPLVEGRLLDVAPSDGYILLNASSPGEALHGANPEVVTDLASRLVPLDMGTAGIWKRLEALSYPAWVSTSSQMSWRNGEGSQGIYGLREVGTRIGATCDPHGGWDPNAHNAVGSERYCFLVSDRHEGLPHLLADYLITLHEVRTRA